MKVIVFNDFSKRVSFDNLELTQTYWLPCLIICAAIVGIVAAAVSARKALADMTVGSTTYADDYSS